MLNAILYDQNMGIGILPCTLHNCRLPRNFFSSAGANPRCLTKVSIRSKHVSYFTFVYDASSQWAHSFRTSDLTRSADSFADANGGAQQKTARAAEASKEPSNAFKCAM